MGNSPLQQSCQIPCFAAYRCVGRIISRRKPDRTKLEGIGMPVQLFRASNISSIGVIADRSIIELSLGIEDLGQLRLSLQNDASTRQSDRMSRRGRKSSASDLIRHLALIGIVEGDARENPSRVFARINWWLSKAEADDPDTVDSLRCSSLSFRRYSLFLMARSSFGRMT